MSLTYLSICSGIEAFSVAVRGLAYHALGFSEIEAFPSAVLAARFGSNLPGEPLATDGVPNFGDFTAIDTDKHKLTLRGDTQYMGKYYFDPFKDYGQSPCDKPRTGSLVLQATPEIACGNPAYWLVNARATYTYDERLSFSVWGKNLTNKFYYVYGLNLNAFYQDYLTRGTPRTWGVEATARF